MEKSLEQEELALRRRLLFRLLRGHRFDTPVFKTEAISDPVPQGMIKPGNGLFTPSGSAAQPPSQDGSQSCSP
ncbi:hypothetical protein K3555_08425 [Leisingera sp. M527]|uniref:hypothetical protein n=1 Tax=unclassified Leisingera TaxID=2614906 RepID=UPI0021A705D2|nr:MULTISPECIES: hypothetical protein [unclassified Leisingera]UWQ31057.1 hypothetical protein K3557_07660 [Leisingera sp. M523]UWQ35115.1 hypothetical protein K3555_08425 [Leisingera sp. M527]